MVEEGRRERGRELALIIFSFILLLSLSQRCHEKEAIGDARCGNRQQQESKQRLKEAKGRQGERKGISDKQIRKCDRRRVSKMTGSVKKQIKTEAKEGRRIRARWRREKNKTRNLPLSLQKKGGRRITWSMA